MDIPRAGGNTSMAAAEAPHVASRPCQWGVFEGPARNTPRGALFSYELNSLRLTFDPSTLHLVSSPVAVVATLTSRGLG